ncbi:MAG: DUF2726 domain-containing protein [Spirochaetales bacterium]
MRSLLLEINGDTALIIAIFLVIIAFAVFLGSVIRNKIDTSQNSNIHAGKFEGTVRVALKIPFMHGDSFKFLNALQKALPLEFIAFPNIGVDTIVKPAGNLIAYNSIAGKYLDFVVFEKITMKPVAVVDLTDPRIGSSPITKQDPAITNTLHAINMPILEFVVEDKYDDKEILRRFLDSQDPYTLAALKKAREQKQSSKR